MKDTTYYAILGRHFDEYDNISELEFLEGSYDRKLAEEKLAEYQTFFYLEDIQMLTIKGSEDSVSIGIESIKNQAD